MLLLRVKLRPPRLAMRVAPLPAFGAEVTGLDIAHLDRWPSEAELREAWHSNGGLLVFRGIAPEPEGLVALASRFGVVEDMVETRMQDNQVHPAASEVFLVHSSDFSRKPPAPPETGNNEALQFPERTGYHSDQSYRRPPPDASLLYCVTPALPNQGRTLFADAAAAFAALPPEEQEAAERLEILHCNSAMGRSEAAVRAGKGATRTDEGAKYLAPVVQCVKHPSAPPLLLLPFSPSPRPHSWLLIPPGHTFARTSSSRAVVLCHPQACSAAAPGHRRPLTLPRHGPSRLARRPHRGPGAWP